MSDEQWNRPQDVSLPAVFWRVVPWVLMGLGAVVMPLRPGRPSSVVALLVARSGGTHGGTDCDQTTRGGFDRSTAWHAGMDADLTEHVVWDALRVDHGPRGTVWAVDRPSGAVVAAVPVRHGWVFVSDDGAVTRARTFTGRLTPVGMLPCGFSVPWRTRGRAVARDDRGQWWSTDGDHPPALLTVPGPCLAVAFADGTHGMAVLEGGARARTDDGGATWRTDREDAIGAWDVVAGPKGGFVVASGAGLNAVDVDGTVGAALGQGAAVHPRQPPAADPSTWPGVPAVLGPVVGAGRCVAAVGTASDRAGPGARGDFDCTVDTRRVQRRTAAHPGDIQVTAFGGDPGDPAGGAHARVATPAGVLDVTRTDWTVAARLHGARQGATPRTTADGLAGRAPDGTVRPLRWVVQSEPTAVRGLAWVHGGWGLVVGSPTDPAVPRYYRAGGGDPVDLAPLPAGPVPGCAGPTPGDVMLLVQQPGWVTLRAGEPGGGALDASAPRTAFGHDTLALVEVTPTRMCVRRMWTHRGADTMVLEATRQGELQGVWTTGAIAEEGHPVRCRPRAAASH